MNGPRAPRATADGRWLAVALALALSACGGSGPSSSGDAGEPAATPTASAAAPAGRLLASNCAQCHGTNGAAGFEDIRGESAGELLEFQAKPAGSNIMAAHAQGYTPEQLNKIAAYLQR